MAKSRYDANGDGIFDVPTCQDVRFLARESKPERIAIARIARTDLAAIGIHLRLDKVDDETFFSTFNDPASRLPIALFGSNRGLPAERPRSQRGCGRSHLEATMMCGAQSAEDERSWR
jgi:hypothetical protein